MVTNFNFFYQYLLYWYCETLNNFIVCSCCRSIWNGNNDLLPICEVANVLKFLHHDDHICNLGDSFCRAESLKIWWYSEKQVIACDQCIEWGLQYDRTGSELYPAVHQTPGPSPRIRAHRCYTVCWSHSGDGKHPNSPILWLLSNVHLLWISIYNDMI